MGIAVSSTSISPMTFSVPFRRSLDFVGREQEIMRLHQALKESRLVGLTGMGGIGKTGLAVEYCYRYRNDYPDGVFWLDAVDPLLAEFALLGESLGRASTDTSRHQAALAAWNYLMDNPGSLVVLDNVDGPGVLFAPFSYGLLVDNLECYVLFTTRRRDLGRVHAIDVTAISEDPALRVLLRHPSRQAILDPMHSENHVARAICQALGRLPLALEIAGAFLGKWPEIALTSFYARLQEEGCLATLDEEAQDLSPSELSRVHEVAVEAMLRTQWDALEQGADLAVSSQRRHLTMLRQILVSRFSEGDLRTLWFDLQARCSDLRDLHYDSLPGEGTANKAREMILHLERCGRVSELIRIGKQQRSDIVWDDVLPEQSRKDNLPRLLLRTVGQLPKAATIPVAWLALFSGMCETGGQGRPSRLDRALRQLRNASLLEDVQDNRVRLHPFVHEFAARLTLEDERTGFRSGLEANVIGCLGKPERSSNSHGWITSVVDCLIGLDWTAAKIRHTVLHALRELMKEGNVSEMDRRNAAFLLTRLRWLDDIQLVSSTEMLTYLELIERYSHSDADRDWLIRKISSLLDSELPSREEAHLLVYRAALQGRLNRLDEAEADYREAKRLTNELLGSEYGAHEDHKLLARISLGIGNIASIRAERLTEPEYQELLQRAVDSLLEAAQAARSYGRDMVLKVGICNELSYNHTLLRNWVQAEDAYRDAFRSLQHVEDPEAYVSYYAKASETASHMRWRKGQSLDSRGERLQALAEYEAACEFAREGIAVLQRSFRESDDLVHAHNNLGVYLVAMVEFSSKPTSQVLDEACGNWQIALRMARHLGISRAEQEAREHLEQHCKEWNQQENACC